MILLLGANGYVGQAFARALSGRKDTFIPLSPNALDYTRFESLFDYVRKIAPDLLINAAGLVDPPTEEVGEAERMEMLHTNTVLPQTIARVCSLTNTPWGHVSSGSIYSGAKVLANGTLRIHDDLSTSDLHALFTTHPEQFHGFSELDEPNFCFAHSPCSFYSGTKALAEESIRDSRCYIWRLRLPFNERDEPFNFLSQFQDGLKRHPAINSLSQLDDCVRACLELWECRAPFGTYNVVNPGAVSSHELIQLIQRILRPANQFPLFVYEGPSERKPVRSDCILDTSKLLSTGIRLPTVHDALARSLQKWQPHASTDSVFLRTTA